MRPNILLFDESTSALDPELVGEVLNVIGKLAHEHDLTMLLVTHEMRIAREISDRVCFFDQGRMREEGAPYELFTDPNEERTRESVRSIVSDERDPVFLLSMRDIHRRSLSRYKTRRP